MLSVLYMQIFHIVSLVEPVKVLVLTTSNASLTHLFGLTLFIKDQP